MARQPARVEISWPRGRPDGAEHPEPSRCGRLGSFRPGSGAPPRAPRWSRTSLALARAGPALAGGPVRCTTYVEVRCR
jgi:hypothetical protein